VEFQSFIFGQILALLGCFGLIWAKFVALRVAESMPKARLKSSKLHNSEIVNPNATWSISLESYYPYLEPQEVSKAPTTSDTYGSLPKSEKAILAAIVL
jgi:hypothetical protein